MMHTGQTETSDKDLKNTQLERHIPHSGTFEVNVLIGSLLLQGSLFDLFNKKIVLVILKRRVIAV